MRQAFRFFVTKTIAMKPFIRRLLALSTVCPTCHKKLNWHLEEKEHPVASVYSDVAENLAVGTDDHAIFGGSMSVEFNEFMRFFSNTQNLSRKEIKGQQSKFRFGS